MPTLQWCEDLELGLGFMDDTHREFVELLAACENAGPEALPAAWNELVAHTERHFRQEDRWMVQSGFVAGNCHTKHHRMVLDVLRDGAVELANGQPRPVQQMIRELALWFPVHAQTMDTALAAHLQEIGFDPATGTIARPEAMPEGEIHSCGSGSCATPAA